MKAVSLSLFLALAASAAAQAPVSPGPQPPPFREEKVGSFKAPGVQAEGVFVGAPLTMDEAFARQHEQPPLQAPFRLTIPKVPHVYLMPGGKKNGSPEIVRVSLATEEKKAREILRFTTLTVPVEPGREQRLVICANLLQKQGLAMASRGYENATLLELYTTRVRNHDAVCLHAEMTRPGTGERYWVKLTGILQPGSPHGLLAFLMADKDLSEIKTLADLGTKGFGLKTIHSLEFIPPTLAAPASASAVADVSSAEALKSLGEKLHAAVKAGNTAEAAALTRALLPDDARLAAALSPEAPADTVAKVRAFHASLPRQDDRAMAGLLAVRPAQSVVAVHAATTESLAQYAEGTPAYEEFPGAARDLARSGLLRPGVMFYEMEFLEPGSDAGMKFHLFYWNGSAWSMLGPVWRALK